jgi:Na+/proline symporter
VAGNWLWWNMVMSGILTVFFYARLWRRAGVMTDVEFTEIRYAGRPAAFLRGFRALYLALPINLIVMGWVNLAMADILGVVLDVPRLWALGACLALTALYSILAGLWAVVLTDFFQFALAVAGAILLAVFAVEAVGGIDALERGVADVYGSRDAALALFPRDGEAWMPVITLAVFLGVNWWASWYPGAEPGGGGYVAQRIFSSKSERDGVLATLWFNLANYAVRPWPWILVALASTILYPGLENPREGYLRAIVDLLPAGLLGLMVASLAAAYMSTISTQLNWGASYLARDLYQRFLDPGASDRRLVAVSRAATTLLLFASLLVTYLMGTIEGAWRFLLALGAGTGLVLILRWYWWRINAWSEIVAMVASLVVSLVLWFGAGLDPDDPVEWAWIILATVAASTVAWLSTTFLTAPESDATLVAFYQRVRPGGPGWARIARAAGYGREPIAGSPFNALNWLAGVVAVYSALFGVGRLIFGATSSATAWLGLAALAFGWIAWDLRRHPERDVSTGEERGVTRA